MTKKKLHDVTRDSNLADQSSSTNANRKKVVTIPDDFDRIIKNLKTQHPHINFTPYHEHHIQLDIESIEKVENDIYSQHGLFTECKDILLHTRVENEELLITIKPTFQQKGTDKIELRYSAYQLSSSTLRSPRERPIPAGQPNVFDSNIDVDDQVILVVEDNKDVATFIASCINDKYKVITATNGKEGLEKAYSNIPDLIISDIMMPELTGLEFCQLIKKDIRTDHIPVILLTAKVSNQDKLDGLHHGADAYITKPFDEDELRLRVENLLHLRDSIQQKILPLANTTSKTEFLETLRATLEANYTNEAFGVQSLAEYMNMSRMQLHRKLKSLVGSSTSEVINEFRIEKSMELITDSSIRISEIAYAVGFSDPGYYTRMFRRKYNTSPSNMRSDKLH